MQIFHQPHANHVAESALFAFLGNQLKGLNPQPERYDFPIERLNKTVNRRFLMERLEADRFLPERKRNRACELLKNLPMEELKVTPFPHRISFDFVIVADETPYFVEFHELQHRSLTVNRPAVVYDTENTAYPIPRFLQRLIRDVWRFQHFENFTVVWKDFFDQIPHDFKFKLRRGKREFALPGQFQFASFLEPRIERA